MFKSYRNSKFTILAGSLIKKCGKFEFSGILGKLELVCQSLLNQAEIFTSPSLHQDKKSLWNFKNWHLNVTFTRKNLKFWRFLAIFDEISVKNWHEICIQSTLDLALDIYLTSLACSLWFKCLTKVSPFFDTEMVH